MPWSGESRLPASDAYSIGSAAVRTVRKTGPLVQPHPRLADNPSWSMGSRRLGPVRHRLIRRRGPRVPVCVKPDRKRALANFRQTSGA